MKLRIWHTVFCVITLLAASFVVCDVEPSTAAEQSDPDVLIVIGPSTHPPGTHEAAAGGRLLEYLVNNAEVERPLRAESFEGWPEDTRLLKRARTIVFIGDTFPPERMEGSAKIKAELTKMMKRGCGIVCVHYATGLRAQDVTADGDHPLLEWMGGYFATGCPHHRSVARICPATIVPAAGDHPVLRGWKQFSFDDEPYWNNYFGKNGMASNVTPLATTMLPPEKPKKEVVAWAVSRADGGRGVGIVFPHYYRNWKIDDLRTLVLNAIYWSAHADVPAKGVQTAGPELSKFAPQSVEP